MKTGIVLGLALAFCSMCQADVDQPCTDKSECNADECCQIINIVVASRRRQTAILPINGNTSGTCQKYKQEGAGCVSFETLNGYCGCGAGLQCKSFYVGPATVGPLGRRDMRPGYASHCTAVSP